MSLEGKQLGRYRILSMVGSGGMSEVYLGEDASIQRRVAIKVLKLGAAQDTNEEMASALRLFLREATAIARLDHPNILPLYDQGEAILDAAHYAYLVTPYRAEGSLVNWLRKRAQLQRTSQLTLRQVAHIVQQAGKALQYAHDHKVIHRDVKPSNFLIRENQGASEYPDLLLADFGIALLSSATSNLSQQAQGASASMAPGQGAGTPSYMAPEQWTGKPVYASDQYALAIMTYELLTGSLPFQGTIWRVMHAHINEVPQPPSELNPQLPRGINAVLLRALAKKPEERFASVSAFAVAFQVAFEGMDEATTLRVLRPSFNTPQIPQVQYPTPLPSASPQSASVLPAIDSAPSNTPTLGADTVPAPQYTAPPQGKITLPPATSDQAQFSAPPAQNQYQQTAGSITLPPRRGELPGELPPGGRSRRNLLVVTAGVVGVAAAGSYLAVTELFHYNLFGLGGSPNPTPTATTAITPGQTVAPTTPTSPPTSAPTPISTPVPLGATLVTYHGHSGGVNSLAGSPDGARVASGSYDKTAQVWDASNGNPFFTYHHDDVVWAVAWSPDGKYIASGGGEFNVNAAAIHDHNIQVWNASTQQQIATYRGHSDSVFTMKWSPDGSRIATGSYDKTVQIWDALSGQQLVTYSNHTWEINHLAWSPDSKRVVSCAAASEVHVWDATNGALLFTIPNALSLPLSVDWSHDGTRIAIAYGADVNSSVVEIRDSSNGKLLGTYLGHTHTSGFVGGSGPLALVLAAGRYLGPTRARRWLSGSGIGVFSVAWSPDDKAIVSGEGGSRYTTQVWDTSTFQTLVNYTGHSSYVDDVLWLRDGKRVASASGDNTVQVWLAR